MTESVGGEPAPLINAVQILNLAERIFLKTFVDGDDPAACAQGAIFAACQFGVTWQRNIPEPRKKRKRKAAAPSTPSDPDGAT